MRNPKTTTFDAKALPISRGRSPGLPPVSRHLLRPLVSNGVLPTDLWGLQLRDSSRFSRDSLFATLIQGGTLMMIIFSMCCCIVICTSAMLPTMRCKGTTIFVIGKKKTNLVSSLLLLLLLLSSGVILLHDVDLTLQKKGDFLCRLA